MEKIALQSVMKQFENNKYNASEVQKLLADEIEKSDKKIIVLDDDPTGVQTVHDIYVFTDWSVESIRRGFHAPEKLFYLLTNSRGLTESQTAEVHTEISHNIMQVSNETGQEFMIISRGDSTLRGHFPLETLVLKNLIEEGTKRKIDGEILFPFFKEGGRFTVADIHYVNQDGMLVPAGDTEFAKDRTFGYTKSNLCEYIEEKTKGQYLAKSVTSISLDSLRNVELDFIASQLVGVKNFDKVVVNALDYQDVEVFCIALYRAIAQGKNFMFRTAASFVKVVGGVSNQPLLTRADMIGEDNGNGGMIVVGSHTVKTTEQLEELRKLDNISFIEFNSDLVLNDKLDKEVDRVVGISQSLILEGKTVVVYTNRKLLVLEDDTPEKALIRSVKISEAVQALVGKLTVQPSFVIAKGGITSSDVGVKALQVKQALVLGQVKPGIPVWKTDDQSKFSGIPYIIFPGNVGETDTLREVVKILQTR